VKSYLKNKCAIIFGATGNIGCKLTLMLAKADVRLIIQGRSREKLKKLDDELKHLGKKATLIHLDVSNFQNYKRIGEIIHKRFKKIDLYFNAISEIKKLTPLTHLNHLEWDRILEINFSSKWKILKQIEFLLQKSNDPYIYFFLHKSEIKKMAYYHAYGLANSALEKLIEVYSEEKKKFNITIKGICKDGIIPLNNEDKNQKSDEIKKIIKKII